MIADFPEIWMDIQDDEGQDISRLRYWYLSGFYVGQGHWNNYGSGYSYGNVNGYGYGYGNGNGNGYGYGNGDGYVAGDVYDEYVLGYGNGDGDGDGDGYGYGYGYGYGNGSEYYLC
jgi:hypothetical protein